MPPHGRVSSKSSRVMDSGQPRAIALEDAHAWKHATSGRHAQTTAHTNST